MEKIMEQMHVYIIQYGVSIIAAVLIFVIGKWIARFLSNTAERLIMKTNGEKTLASFGRNIVYVVLLVFVIIAAIGKLGVQTTSFIAVIGAAGLAVGLALQGSLSNFAAGVLIIVFKPFKVGDFIQAGGVMGTVSEIQIFTT
ncbi:MAG TPA: mechanosensitive ion channel, partial [bacterium]|nr:mechanosensitive ion channel [bacterium]